VIDFRRNEDLVPADCRPLPQQRYLDFVQVNTAKSERTTTAIASIVASAISWP
jgi:hypothetical protein